MGLENKLYFVRPYYDSVKYQYPNGEYYHSQIFAVLDMCKMGYSPEVERFRKAFKNECDFTLLITEYDDKTGMDVLKNVTHNLFDNKQLCYASVNQLIPYVKKIIEKSNDKEYWLFHVLYGMLKTFEPYNDILVVDYPY